MPSDLTPFPKPGAQLGPDHHAGPAPLSLKGKRPRNRMLLSRRLVWLVPLYLFGGFASRAIRGYYGGDVLPNTTHWILVFGLAIAAGCAGGIALVATRWSSVFLMALLGAAIWALAFVDAIPATRAICGGDVASGCEHVQAIEWPIVAAGAYVPILVGLLVPTSLWWRLGQRSL
jgi:hypothetical protein